MNRKDFIKTGGLAAAAMAIMPTGKLFANMADPKVRLAIIGVGARGQGHLDLLLRRDDVELGCHLRYRRPCVESLKRYHHKEW